MNYRESLDWLYSSQLTGIKLGLDGINTLLTGLGQPHHQFACLHVAGTNGKGSVCAMLASILRQHGLKTGLFTSPHLVDFRERMTINGDLPDEVRLAEGLTRLRALADTLPQPPTFFELVTALAFEFFASEKVDCAVLETGLGGRLDATNVVTPQASILTSISLDHTQWLGETLVEIAGEKAGIIKPGRPVFTTPQAPEVMAVFERKARQNNAPFHCITGSWQRPLSLTGKHQKQNAALAAAVIEQIYPEISTATVSAALARTSWPGRFQRINRFLVDGAHNPSATETLVATWQDQFPGQRCTLIFGALADKHWEQSLQLLDAISERIWVVPVRSPRSVEPPAMLSAFPRASSLPDLASAVKQSSDYPETVLITGSLFLAGEALALLQSQAAPTISTQ